MLLKSSFLKEEPTTMKRRDFLRTTGLAAAAATFNVPRVHAEQRRPSGDGPNVLVVMTDQQFAGAMSCRLGHAYINTPNMDRLADEGTLFTRAYCANPICVPSRTAIFTGRYPHTTGVQDNGRYRPDPALFPTLGTVFQRAGYSTGYVGKWHLPYPSGDGKSGFDFARNLKGKGWDKETPGLVDEFLRRPRANPFLLVASFCNPHNICEWARRQTLPDGPIGEAPQPDGCPPLASNHAPPAGEIDLMAWMRKSYQASATFPVGRFDDDKWRQYIWAYYRMIEMVDAHLGRILDSLSDSGAENDTLVVFTSDHGDCHGAHGWNQKTVFYDESTRVPLIVRRPGATSAVSDKLVNTGIDLMPTLCDQAGIAPPDGLPGRSLRPIVEGEHPHDWREYVVASNHLVQGASLDGVSRKPHGRMLRSERYKYCLYSEGQRRESLVDMKADPGEMVNQAANPPFAATLAEHRQALARHAQSTADRRALEMLAAAPSIV